jgi:two-component system chemotaxis response regulator CheY
MSAPASPRVLVVDDSGSFRVVVKVALQRWGYEVDEAASAEEACTLLDGHPPDLIVCDLNMPGMNGLAFVRHLRSVGHAQLPVMMLTTEASDRHPAHAELDIAAWITKPFSPTQLIEAVQRVCPV